MDYTQSNSYDTDAGTGHRLHNEAKAIPTAWSEQDANSIIWSVMAVLEAAGVEGAAFNKSVPASYGKLVQAIRKLGGGVVGSMRSGRMAVAAASASATLTADEVLVGTALGGELFRLGGFNKTVNLATVGAGGMDVGTAPTSGYVALYAIYNPITATGALLAVNATSAAAPQVYGGANMPAGFTASALVSVWPTTAGKQFATGVQIDRSVSVAGASVLSSNAPVASPTALLASSVLPPNARFAIGGMAASSSAASATAISVYASSAGVGQQGFNFSVSVGGSSFATGFRIPISTPQTLFYVASNTAGTPSFVINVYGYEF